MDGTLNKILIDSMQKWIHTNVNNEHVRSIHLDELANYDRDQKSWLADSILLFRGLCASALVNDYDILLVISLKNKYQSNLIPSKTIDIVLSEMTPPSFYVAKNGNNDIVNTVSTFRYLKWLSTYWNMNVYYNEVSEMEFDKKYPEGRLIYYRDLYLAR